MAWFTVIVPLVGLEDAMRNHVAENVEFSAGSASDEDEAKVLATNFFEQEARFTDSVIGDTVDVYPVIEYSDDAEPVLVGWEVEVDGWFLQPCDFEEYDY